MNDCPHWVRTLLLLLSMMWLESISSCSCSSAWVGTPPATVPTPNHPPLAAQRPAPKPSLVSGNFPPGHGAAFTRQSVSQSCSVRSLLPSFPRSIGGWTVLSPPDRQAGRPGVWRGVFMGCMARKAANPRVGE